MRWICSITPTQYGYLPTYKNFFRGAFTEGIDADTKEEARAKYREFLVSYLGEDNVKRMMFDVEAMRKPLVHEK